MLRFSYSTSFRLGAVVLTLCFIVAGVSVPAHRAQAQMVPVVDSANISTNASNVAQDTVSAIENVWSTLKEASLDAIAWNVAKMAIDQMSANIVSWIRGGFEGQPAFVTNPERFLGNIARVQFNAAVRDYLRASDQPFSESVARAMVATRQLEGAVYNLDQAFSSDAEERAFRNGDFSQGGWSAWHKLTQNPSNNPFGAYLNQMSKARSRIASRVQSEKKQLEWGQGFKSFASCAEKGKFNNCIVKGEIKTPGKLIEGQLANTMGSEIRQLEVADEINEIVSALLGELTQQAFSATGLTGREVRQAINGINQGASALETISEQQDRQPDRDAARQQKQQVQPSAQEVQNETGQQRQQNDRTEA